MSGEKPYATCDECGLAMRDVEEMHRHESDTLGTGKPGTYGERGSHSVTVNPARQKEVDRQVSSLIDEALSGFIAELGKQIKARKFTEAEAMVAMRHNPEFAEMWTNWKPNL